MSEATTLPNVPQPQAIFLIDKISKIDVQLKKAHSFRKSTISEESIQNIRKFEKNVGDQNSRLGDSICSTKEKKFATKNIFEIKPMKVCFRQNLKFSLDSLSAKFQPLGINSMNASQLVRYNYWYFYH